MELTAKHFEPSIVIQKFFVSALLIFTALSCNHSHEIKKSQSPYEPYIKQTEENISRLSSERKENRDNLYLEVKSNYAYKSLVEQHDQSTEFLPLLNAIANAISFTNPDGFSIDEDFARQVETSNKGTEKMRFVTLVSAFAGKQFGGVPTEIIEVFDRFKNCYKIYGDKGLLIDVSGQKSEIAYSFDLSPFFGMIEPTNKDILNSIYEAKQKGFSEWTNTSDATYPYLASKNGYMALVSEIYPDSPYLLIVADELTALELHSAYDRNEVSADEKYKGKQLALSGIIGNIGKDILGDPYITLQVYDFQSVTCSFDKNQINQLTNLGKGQKITITGKCEGLNLGSVIMMDCQLWQ